MASRCCVGSPGSGLAQGSGALCGSRPLRPQVAELFSHVIVLKNHFFHSSPCTQCTDSELRLVFSSWSRNWSSSATESYPTWKPTSHQTLKLHLLICTDSAYLCVRMPLAGILRLTKFDAFTFPSSMETEKCLKARWGTSKSGKKYVRPHQSHPWTGESKFLGSPSRSVLGHLRHYPFCWYPRRQAGGKEAMGWGLGLPQQARLSCFLLVYFLTEYCWGPLLCVRHCATL